MKMETYNAEKLNMSKVIMPLVVDVLNKLASNSYKEFDMANGECCIIAKVREAALMDGTETVAYEFNKWLHENPEVHGVYYGSFLNNSFAAAHVSQPDAAWVLRHYLTTGLCPTPDEYECRHSDFIIL